MTKTVSKTVHFTVQDQFLTNHARNLWSEGEYRKAMDFLGTTGVNVIQAHRIIAGHLKFEEVGKTQTFKLVKDSWKPNLSMCHHCQYPDPSNGEEMANAEAVLENDRAEKLWSVQLYKMLDEAGDNPKALRHIQNLALTRQLQKTYPMLRDEDYTETMQTISALGASNTVLEEFILDTKINDSVSADIEKKQKPFPSHVYETGIITPDGLFYRCGALGHINLAIALGYGSEDGGDPEGLEPDVRAVKEGCVVLSANHAMKKIRAVTINAEQKPVVEEWLSLVKYLTSPLVKYED